MDVSPKRNAAYFVNIFCTMLKSQYLVCTNLLHQVAMATELRKVAPIICDFHYEIAICHTQIGVAPKIMRNLYTPTIDHYFMCDVIIDSSIMSIFMLLQKLRLDRQFLKKKIRRSSGKLFQTFIPVHK